jgi:hypothetical protein
MPLPFLVRKPNQGGISTEVRKPDQSPEDNEEDQGLMACAEDLINAVHSRDKKATAEALKAAFELMDSEPHNEGEHTNEQEEGQE